MCKLLNLYRFQIVLSRPIAAALSLYLVDGVPRAYSLQHRCIDLIPMVFVLAHECLGSRIVDLQLFCALNHREVTSLISLWSHKTFFRSITLLLWEILSYRLLRFLVLTGLKKGIPWAFLIILLEWTWATSLLTDYLWGRNREFGDWRLKFSLLDLL